jgi:poly(A) polymerase
MEDLRLVVKPEASRLLTRASRFLTEKGIPAYLVGGFVRDMLLGRNTADIDIAVAADALSVAQKVAAALDGKYIPLDEENGVGRVILAGNKWQVDFTALKGDIEQDLAKRDFTIDAIAIEIEKRFEAALSIERLIDPFQGREDLCRGIVRAVSETVFADDAARLLRAVRLAAELGFNIASDTERLIRQDCRLITGVAGERVREELLRLLAIPGAGKRLAYLDELGLLTALLPELNPARGVDQPRVHIWDVFDHSIQTVSAAEFLLREGTWEYASAEALAAVPWSEELSRHFDREISRGSTRRSLLKLAALLHDIAKPQTRTIDDDGRARFLGHQQEGASTAAAILERLRFSHREIKLVELLVKYHMRPTQMGHEGIPTHRAIYRYFRDTGEVGIDLLFLCLADHLATRGPHLGLSQWQEHAQMTGYVLARHAEESLSAPPKLINGHDVMKIFGLSPGPQVGELLEALQEAQAAGEVTTRHQALDYIEGLLNSQTQILRSEPSQGEK